MRIKSLFMKGEKAAFTAALLLLKLPFQWIRPRRPELFVHSAEGHRFPVYLSLALAAEFVIEIRAKDLGFFYRYLSFHDFLWRTVVLLPGKTPASPLVLGASFPSKTTIALDDRYYLFPEQMGPHLRMPYFAHPEFYRRKLHFQAGGAEAGPRRFRIFFAGTWTKDGYTDTFRFPILNRYEILRYIQDHFGDQVATSMEGSPKPITLLLTDDNRDVLEKHRLSPDGFFRALQESDFFIAPPGWVMPHCHNLIEAMAAGAIPITNYGRFFDPPLQPDVNCLAFDNLEDLDRVLRQAIALSTGEVDVLRRGTREYYRRHLDPAAFGASLRQAASSPLRLIVNGERADYAVAPEVA